jgi:large subunit ribosomal protein L25
MAKSESASLQVTPREVEGSRATRRLRRTGRVPAVIYGGDGESVPVSVDARELRHALHAAGAVIELSIDGDTQPVVLKDTQLHPVRGETWHVDFLRVRMDVAIQSTVTLELVGAEESPGTTEGGVLEQQLRELSIEALPGDIPESVTHDVSALELNGTVHVSDVTAPSGVTILDDPESVVASITLPRIEVEPEPETETELVGEDGEPIEAPEGEAAEGEGEGEASAEEGGDSSEESSE